MPALAFHPHVVALLLDSILIVINRLLQNAKSSGMPALPLTLEVSPSRRRPPPLSLFPSQTLCIHTHPNSLSLRKNSTRSESSKSKLFRQNTRGGAPSAAARLRSRPVCSPFVFMVLQIAFPGTRLF